MDLAGWDGEKMDGAGRHFVKEEKHVKQSLSKLGYGFCDFDKSYFHGSYMVFSSGFNLTSWILLLWCLVVWLSIILNMRLIKLLTTLNHALENFVTRLIHKSRDIYIISEVNYRLNFEHEGPWKSYIY